MRVIKRSEGGRQGNQIYQLPKKTILEKFEIGRNRSIFKNDLFNSFPTYPYF